MLKSLNRPRFRGRQRRIGLTGGIASGKSSVGALLQAHGWPVLDADRYAREALAPGTPAEQAVLERYGERVLLPGSAAATLPPGALPALSDHTPEDSEPLDQARGDTTAASAPRGGLPPGAGLAVEPTLAAPLAESAAEAVAETEIGALAETVAATAATPVTATATEPVAETVAEAVAETKAVAETVVAPLAATVATTVVATTVAEMVAAPVTTMGAATTRAATAAEPVAEAVAEPGLVGRLDRAALGRIVFADAGERRWLEQLVHPIVRDRFAAELERLQAEPTVVLMIPLLFEAGLEALCSEVWLVVCDPHQQQQRLMARNGLTPTEARARLAAQWPLARKRPLAERLIDNRGSLKALEQAVAALLAAADANAGGY